MKTMKVSREFPKNKFNDLKVYTITRDLFWDYSIDENGIRYAQIDSHHWLQCESDKSYEEILLLCKEIIDKCKIIDELNSKDNQKTTS